VVHYCGRKFAAIMNEAFLLTGGNIGERLEYLSAAKELIEKRCGRILSESSIYETAAWGIENQQAFLNQVLKIETLLTSGKLLKTILQIEEELGRKRELKYGPRTIDIDILFFNDEVIDQHGLKVPHPQMQNRRFVLVPLNEIASSKIHPLFQKTISQILAECPDPLAVNKFN
jgi:2-amino-4-hydroxy-6-hydroxymethyldihydropteridine diphosphokinase